MSTPSPRRVRFDGQIIAASTDLGEVAWQPFERGVAPTPDEFPADRVVFDGVLTGTERAVEAVSRILRAMPATLTFSHGVYTRSGTADDVAAAALWIAPGRGQLNDTGTAAFERHYTPRDEVE